MKKIDKRTTDYRQAVKGINAYYQAAGEQDIKDGLSWYRTAQLLAVDLSRKHRTEFHKVVGVIAAMSTNKAWYDNKRIADLYLAGQRDGLHFGVIIDKCNRIITARTFGEVCQILNGEKITAFARNIYGDLEPVTVDRHVLEMCGIDGALTPYRKRLIQTAFNEACNGIAIDDPKFLGEVRAIYPAELQAITWCSFRRLNGKLQWGANL